jgi:O-antigen/teichoic acid export membrane protein
MATTPEHEIGADPGAAASFGRRSSAANTLYSFAIRAIAAVFTIGLTLFLVRRLTPGQFGLFGTAAAIGGLVLLPAEFGVSAATARYVSEHHRERRVVAEIVRDSFLLKLVLTGATCVVLAAAAPLAAAVGMPEGLVWPVRVMSAVVFAQSVMTLSVSILDALGRSDLNLRVYAIESVVETGLAVAFVLGGAGAVGALGGRALGYAVAAAVAFVVVRRLTGVGRGTTGRARWRRRLLGYGGALLIVDSAFALFSQIDILLIAALRSSTTVAVFAAPLRFTAFLLLPAAALTSGVVYRFGRPEDWDRESSAFVRATRHVLVAQGFMVAPLLVWATPVADVLFGRGAYPGSVGVLRAIVPFVVLSGFGNLFSLTANYLGEARRRVPIAIVTVIVNTAVDVVLIPRIGTVGGAVGTDVAYALYAPAHALICFRVLNVSPRVFLRPAAGVVGATTVMSLVLLTLGTGHLGALRILAGGVAATAAYVATVLVTGTITEGERRRLLVWARARAGLRRARSAA